MRWLMLIVFLTFVVLSLIYIPRVNLKDRTHMFIYFIIGLLVVLLISALGNLSRYLD